MRGVNKVILVGNLGRDPEVRYLPSGGAVANVTIATSEVWRDKNTGQQQEQTEWHRVVFYGRLAEIAGEYLKKGSKVYVEGSLHTRKWQDKNTGQDRFSTEIKANTMQMLDSRSQGDDQWRPVEPMDMDSFAPGGRPFPGSNEGFGQPSSMSSAPSMSSRPQGNPQGEVQGGNRPMPDDDFDDDIPF